MVITKTRTNLPALHLIHKIQGVPKAPSRVEMIPILRINTENTEIRKQKHWPCHEMRPRYMEAICKRPNIPGFPASDCQTVVGEIFVRLGGNPFPFARNIFHEARYSPRASMATPHGRASMTHQAKFIRLRRMQAFHISRVSVDGPIR